MYMCIATKSLKFQQLIHFMYIFRQKCITSQSWEWEAAQERTNYANSTFPLQVSNIGMREEGGKVMNFPS
jgi:hypothetical protein